MDGGALYTFTKSLAGGVSIDPTTFNTLLATAQLEVENESEWLVLKKKDSTKTVASGDTFATAKALPADFLKWVSMNPVKAVNSVSNPTQYNLYNEIPFELQTEYKDDQKSFYTDYANNNLYLCGTPFSGYTILMFYLFKPANVNYDPVTAANNTSWVFPSWTHPILGFLVAAMHELGVDYDDLNARMGNENYGKAMLILKTMRMWNAKLQKGSIKNMDVIGQSGRAFSAGRVNLNDQ